MTDGNLTRKSVLKRIWYSGFHGYRNFSREWLLGGEHLTNSSTKTAQTINFNLCTHVFNRLLHKTMPSFFLVMSCSFFIAIIRRVLKAFSKKTVTSWLCEKYLRGKKLRSQFCLPFGWLHIGEKFLLKTEILLVQEFIN